MNRCVKVEPKVKEILETIPETRADDFLLIYEVYRLILPDIDNYSFSEVMLHHRELGLPYFETIRRSRPKLQNKYPELRPSIDVQIAREELEEEYRDYALDRD